jgi:hypothetical protein
MQARGPWRIAAAVVAAAVLGGCGATAMQPHPILRESTEIGAQPICCTGFRDMPYVTLPPAQKKTFQIDPLSPVYMFKEGRSRFLAVQLPPSTAVLRVRSNVITAWVEPTTFDPSVTFLDKNFNNLGEVAYQLRVSGDAMGKFWEGTVPVPRAAAYAILYTKPSTYLTRRPDAPPALVSGAQPMSSPITAFPTLAGPRGELVLEVQTR